MSFGDVLEQWENLTAKPYGKKKVARDKRLDNKANSNGVQPKSVLAHKENTKRLNPQELWMRKHGVINKESLAEDAQDNHRKSSVGKKRLQKIPADDEIDLHGMTCDEAEIALRGFFNKAVANGFCKVLIVHGKGNHSKAGAVLAPFVRLFLEKHKHAGETGHPKEADGGTGSTWVMIK